MPSPEQHGQRNRYRAAKGFVDGDGDRAGFLNCHGGHTGMLVPINQLRPPISGRDTVLTCTATRRNVIGRKFVNTVNSATVGENSLNG